MKRGLKAYLRLVRCALPSRYNRYPDEKGTESSGIQTETQPPILSYNRYPDEKGTESQIGQAGKVIDECYNRYPDEKGTESECH